MKYARIYQTDASDRLALKGEVKFAPDPTCENRVVNIYPEMRFQSVLGFGGAFTESAAINYAKLGDEGKREAIKALFDTDEGLGYRFCRMHIGSCDFSSREYAYVDPDDVELKSFDLGKDREYILPMVKDAVDYVGDDLFLFASPWSPPKWMKTNGDTRFGGQIKDEYKDVWAKYVCKYILAYRAEGVNIRAITIQNEPIASQTWESCYYSARDEMLMIRDHIAPALDAAGLQDIKIIIWDHNKERVYDRARDVFADEAVRARAWGIGFHWYSGSHFDNVALAAKAFPEMKLIETEFCTGMSRAAAWNSYALELLGNLNAGMNASTDWNMLLDEAGGPYHYRSTGCDAVMLVDSRDSSIEYRTAYWQTAHFSRFIKVGAVRLGASSYDVKLNVTAFENPDSSIAAVFINEGDDREVCVRINDKTAKISLRANSVTTAIIK